MKKRPKKSAPASNEANTLKCPDCSGTAFTIAGASIFDGLKCSDCGHILKPPAQRHSEPGKRHRRDHGPTALAVKPVPPPDPQSLGSLHLHTAAIIAGGPDALFHAHHQAAKLSAKFGEELEAKWFLKTKWLSQLATTHRARARYALVWRPRFLGAVALSRSVMIGCKAAKVAFGTYELHRDRDDEFAGQCLAAEAHAVELLHDVAFKRALEGDCEPIFWQGISVGHVIKYDGRLQLEMLRAHKPDRFKTPGTQAAVINNHQTFVVDPALADAMIHARQEALEQMRRAATLALPESGIIEVEAVPVPS